MQIFETYKSFLENKEQLTYDEIIDIGLSETAFFSSTALTPAPYYLTSVSQLNMYDVSISSIGRILDVCAVINKTKPMAWVFPSDPIIDYAIKKYKLFTAKTLTFGADVYNILVSFDKIKLDEAKKYIDDYITKEKNSSKIIDFHTKVGQFLGYSETAIKEFTNRQSEKISESVNINSYIHYLPNQENNKVIDLTTEPELDSILYKVPTEENIKILDTFLNKNKLNLIRLYHGTSSEFDILKDGLLKTTLKSKKSMQSEPGYVYLSIYKDSARTFGDIAYPYNKPNVYEVLVPISELKPDTDQLYNVAMYSGIHVKPTLGSSALYGHGFRVKGNIPPYMIKLV